MTALAGAAAAAAARALDRPALAAALAARLVALGAPAESVAAARRLGEPGVVAVVAGQQPVLFGGPAFVATKALHAVAVARALEDSGTPAVPVFWVASEDHDHAEADHVEVLAADGRLERVAVPFPGDRTMLSRTPLDAAAALARLADLLPHGPGRGEALAAAAPEPGDSAGTAFARTLLRLAGRFGLVVAEPETLRPFARAVVRHEIEHPGALSAAIVAAEEAVAAHAADGMGAPRPLGLRRGPLFFVVDRRGRRHRPQGLPGPDDAAGRAKWLRRLDESPAEFSWDVAGRVLAQDVALPVAAQVCGPSELAYCAVVAPAHALLGVPAPALVPRVSVTFEDERWPGLAMPDQERRVSILSFVAREGPGILGRVVAAFGASPEARLTVRLGGA